jgi:hypothetical protein
MAQKRAQHQSKIVSDPSASLRSWNVNLALDLSNRAGFTLQPPPRPSGKRIEAEAILLLGRAINAVQHRRETRRQFGAEIALCRQPISFRKRT